MRYEFFTGKCGIDIFFGVAANDKVINLSNSIGKFYDENIETLSDFIRYSQYYNLEELVEHGNVVKDLKNLTVLPPIPVPFRNPICVGKNYVGHLNEVKGIDKETNIPEVPIYFTKLTNICTGHNEDLIVDKKFADELDYEGELVIVIGKEGKNIKREDAHKYIFGLSCGNDFSQRRLQRDHRQWLMGKSLDGFTAMGPFIVKDESIDYKNLKITTRVNGEYRQKSNTKDMIFGVDYLIENLSSMVTLEPGDIIFTGTPQGVGAGFTPNKFLKDGDVVDVEIAGIGVLRNKVVVR